MNLKNTAHKYVEDVKGLTEQCKKRFGAMMLEEDALTGEQFELFRSMFGLLDTSTQLIRKQADTIQDINDKLNILLRRSEKES